VGGWIVQELQEQKAELVAKVQALKAGLQEWRIKVDNDVKNYKDVREAAATACCKSLACSGSQQQPVTRVLMDVATSVAYMHGMLMDLEC
jgi:hypothetical protein